MSVKIFYTVNTGLYIESDQTNILIDGIHTGTSCGFSNMPPELLKDLENHSGIFRNIRNLLFTHIHPDHYNKELVERFLQHASPSLFCPGAEENTINPIPLEKNIDLLRMDGIDILSINLPHEGEPYKDVDNRSYLLSVGDTNIFIAGDSVIDKNMQLPILKYTKGEVHYTFANTFQLIHPVTREFLSGLHPDRLFLYHLPFEEDDRYYLYKITENSLKKLPDDFIPIERIKHMSWIDL